MLVVLLHHVFCRPHSKNLSRNDLKGARDRTPSMTLLFLADTLYLFHCEKCQMSTLNISRV